MAHPYRTRPPVIQDLAPPEPPEPVEWRKYRRRTRCHALVVLLFFSALAYAWSLGENDVWFVSEYGGSLAMITYCLAALVRCPFCSQRIATGPTPGTWPRWFGFFPKQCTHCAAPVGATKYKKPEPQAEQPKLPRKRRARRIADDVLAQLEAETPLVIRRTVSSERS